MTLIGCGYALPCSSCLPQSQENLLKDFKNIFPQWRQALNSSPSSEVAPWTLARSGISLNATKLHRVVTAEEFEQLEPDTFTLHQVFDNRREALHEMIRLVQTAVG